MKKPKACVNPDWPRECPMVEDDASVCEKDCFFICTICNKGFDKSYAYSLSYLCDEHKKFVIGEFQKREGIKATISTDMSSIVSKTTKEEES